MPLPLTLPNRSVKEYGEKTRMPLHSFSTSFFPKWHTPPHSAAARGLAGAGGKLAVRLPPSCGPRVPPPSANPIAPPASRSTAARLPGRSSSLCPQPSAQRGGRQHCARPQLASSSPGDRAGPARLRLRGILGVGMGRGCAAREKRKQRRNGRALLSFRHTL
ncbi:hypothetical protein PVAP13_3KG557250 [Panicum virgatum]|uniref:Uncharacterized protein n=1 Tax=Panicum virgatum TaxID=38727 RepID=A0A8T0VDS3_PANVG|nr:hypothetical protein PVAP13_3KG557250 [Panicum virgatum]